ALDHLPGRDAVLHGALGLLGDDLGGGGDEADLLGGEGVGEEGGGALDLVVLLEQLEGGLAGAEIAVVDALAEDDEAGAGERGGEGALPRLAEPAERAAGLGALAGGEGSRGGEDAPELPGGAVAGPAQGADGEEAGLSRRGGARGGHLADAVHDGEGDVLQ